VIARLRDFPIQITLCGPLCSSALVKSDIQREFLFTAIDRDLHGVAGMMGIENIRDILGRFDLLSIDLYD